MDEALTECIESIDSTITSIDNLRKHRIKIEDDLLECVGFEESETWEKVFSEREREEKILSRRYNILRTNILSLCCNECICSVEGKSMVGTMKDANNLHQQFVSKWRDLQDTVIARLAELEADHD